MVSQKTRGYNPDTFKGGVMLLITVDSLLCCAALCDIKSGKIPNVIPLVVLILGGILKIENGLASQRRYFSSKYRLYGLEVNFHKAVET